MIRSILTFAAIGLFTAAAHAQAPCSVLTPDQIKAVASVPVNSGEPAGTKDAPDCTWKDANGQDRVYLSLQPRDHFNVTRAQMQNTGRLSNVSGVGEDAFFVTSAAGSTAYLYAMGKRHLLLITVNVPNASRQDNEAAEKALATQILPKL